MKTILKTLLVIPLLVGLATPIIAGSPKPIPAEQITLNDVLAVCREYLVQAEKNNDHDWLTRFLEQVPVPVQTKKDIAALCLFHHQGAHDMITLRTIKVSQ